MTELNECKFEIMVEFISLKLILIQLKICFSERKGLLIQRNQY